MKTVQQPRNTTEVEDSVTGAEGQIRVDTTRNELRLHDGQRQGGHRIPNVETVARMIATGGDGTSQGVIVVTSAVDLTNLTPAANRLVVLNYAGLEDIFVWQAGAAPDAGAITSAVEGHWQRLDSQVGLYVRMYRAGLFAMQINGTTPASNQDTTAWIDNGTVKLYNGAAYVAATPALFARLLASIGGYATGSAAIPDRLGDLTTEITDLNTIDESGWYKSSASATNAPVSGVHVIEHRQIDADDAIQTVYLHNSTGRDAHVRYQIAGTWGSWVLVPGILPARLESTSSTITDANSGNESGFFNVASTAANIPVSEAGTIQTVKRSSTAMSQIFFSTDANKVYERRMTAGVWQAWVGIYPADMGTATGTLSRASVGITTIGQAEAEAGVATTDRIWTAERVAQAITNLIGGALRTIRALSLSAGDILYATGAGVVARLPIGSSGQYLKVSGGLPVWATGPGTVDIQTFDASGTWTKPAGCTMAMIEGWGGGGSGARSSNNISGGGGGGAYNRLIIPLSLLAATETVTVGAGGAANTVGGAGSPGSASTFGSVFSVAGGLGGAPSGSVASSNGGTVTGVSNGITATDPVDPFHGAAGGYGAVGKASHFGGGGGGGGTGTGGGNQKAGGNSLYGGDGGQGGGPTAGVAGSQPGGGGGNGNNQNSGAGGAGRIIVTCW